MRRVLLFIVIFSILTPVALHAGKPLPPLEVTIAPTQADITPADIKPGDVAEFKVSARSFTDAQEMRVMVELTGGAELVSGDTSWAGPVVKGEEKVLTLTVRAPLKGKGKIKARVTIPGAHGQASFGAEAQYHLGGEAKKKAEPKPPVKKDSRGRDIIEYGR